MNFHYNKYLAFLLLISWSSTPMSEPTPSISKILNDPISLMDFGIYKLEQFIRSDSTLTLKGTARFVYYDWDSNKINIDVIDLLENTEKLKDNQLKENCTEKINWIKFTLGYIDDEEKNTYTSVVDTLKEFFTHSGYTNKNNPEGWKAIENIINITVKFDPRDIDKRSGELVFFECTSALKSSKILYSQ